MEDCETAINIKKDYSKAYYRRAVCYLNMREFRKSWNDLIYILKESPNSQEILNEVKSLMNKWKTESGNEEYAKIEAELNKEFEEAESYDKSDQPIFNKNDEQKPAVSAQEKSEINHPKASESKVADNKNEQPSKKGFKKIQIFEEEILEEKTAKESEASKTKKESEPEVYIEPDLSIL